MGLTLRPATLPAQIGTMAALRSEPSHGPRVLALHGWLDNAASFVPLAAHLPASLQLVALDLPGHGQSAQLGPGAEYTTAVAMNAVLDVADALGWDHFHLLGHSMGAGIATMLAAACPQRVQGLVAIEALGMLGEDVDALAERLPARMAASRLWRVKTHRVFPDLATPIRARMQANGLSEANARLLVERGVRAVDGGHSWSSDPRLNVPTLVRMSHAQIDAVVATLACPARVLLADPPQPYFPEPMRSRRAALIARGETVVLPGTHHLHMEQPQAVAAAIGDFFR